VHRLSRVRCDPVLDAPHHRGVRRLAGIPIATRGILGIGMFLKIDG
jgi:hypothetical protein